MTPFFTGFPEFQTFAQERAAALAMEAQLCTLQELEPDWVTSKYSVKRPDDKFFYVGGVRILRAAGRAIRRWLQPIFVQPSGHVGLVHQSEPDFTLVRLFAEPGNKGIEVDGTNTRVLVGPPVQISPGNLDLHKKALRGEVAPDGEPYKQLPFADVVLGPVEWSMSVKWEDGAEDGGRFWEKVNQYGYVQVLAFSALDPVIESTGQPENFAWVSRNVLRQARQEGMVNGHLRAAMSLLV